MTQNLNEIDPSAGVLIEAEAFDDFGGWVMDSQFETLMGSPYLMAHGLGEPVADATTTVELAASGQYEVWVRAKDWVPGHHPGRFDVSINGRRLDTTFGANDEDWSWQSGGKVTLDAGSISIALHDLTGFCGRCDAIYLSADGTPPPNEVDEASRAWRKVMRGLPPEPADAGHYDVVVVGGGISGCAAALAAARLNQTVALIHDRPVLGGNASKEIGLMPRGAQGALLQELSQRTPDGDLVAFSLLAAEPSAKVFLEHRVIGTEVSNNKIVAVDAVEARSGQEYRISGKMFIDTSGVARLGLLAGAQTMYGREARAEYDESYAPEQADDMHHGNTLFFRTGMLDAPKPFPEVPWATEIAKDYANLSGQLIEPGLENGPGPSAGNNPTTPVFQYKDFQDMDGDDDVPATHFWEYGQWLDPYTECEHIRDYLMCALFGTFSNVKLMEPDKYANLSFEWMAYVPAQGEFHRYRGDHVLTENDIRNHTVFEDAIIANDGSFCIHCAWDRDEDAPYDFRLKDWIWDSRDRTPYAIPFRCLYSANIDNLLCAGKHISVSSVASSSTKFMGNGAQHGVAVAAASSLCIELDVTPRELGQLHLDALKTLMHDLTSCDHDLEQNPPERKFKSVFT
ncbi:MAG: FAD-dependent oxidoreductase [Pseudomonadota bacterium]